MVAGKSQRPVAVEDDDLESQPSSFSTRDFGIKCSLPCGRVVLRKLLIVAALAALLATAVATAASGSHDRSRQDSQTTSTTTELLPGVTYTREVDLGADGPTVLDVVTAPRPDGSPYSLAPALSNDALRGTETLAGLGRRLSADATTVAIDGDYFNRFGLPNGILVQGGVLEREPMAHRSSLSIGSDGTLAIGRISFSGLWQGSGQRRELQLNTPAGKGRFTLYTPAYGAKTPAETGSVAEAVLGSFPPAVAGEDLAGTVTEVVSGSTAIPRDGAVLVARGNSAAQLGAEAPVGQQVDVWLTLSPATALANAIGGGPVLVRNGKPVFAAGEAFDPRILDNADARGAIGQLANGQIVLVTVEATSSAGSVGMSSYELARELVELGATTAIELGSGRSAGLAFDGSLLSSTAKGPTPRVSDALVLSYSGVYAAPPSTPVLSPNGDGIGDTETLSYRIVRPSTVSATLTGPGGAKVTLASGAEQPGTYTADWDGTENGTAEPEGAWTFSVGSTDDRGIATTAQQTFSLDDTLGSLAVARGSGRQETASFQLARPADVVVRIERPSGVAVATVSSGELEAGPQRVTWNGRIGHGLAQGGRYQVTVEAKSKVGTSTLTAPFTLPPLPRRPPQHGHHRARH